VATQWEYKVICLENVYPGRREAAEKELNAAGSDGWEVVAITGELTILNVILKRPKSE
jgi:hypothetical protein